MKVLILANNDLGLYNFRKELIEKLIELKYEVYISLPEGPKVKDLIDLGCTFIETDVDRRGTNPIKDLMLIFKYKKIIKDINPDIVLTYTIKPNIYGGIASRIRKIPYIANITGLGTALENEGLLQKILIHLYRIALKNVKCCFAQNEENLNFLKKHRFTKEDRFRLIPGSGVNLEKFKLLSYPDENDKIRFLFISRIMKEKGIDQYLETAQYIVAKYKNTEFHILGFCEQEYEEKLKQLEEKGIIIYHGRQDNIIPYLENCSCLIHPSYYPEGMSNVLLEASASGRPVITTNRSGCKEIVEDGKTGFIVPIKATEQLKNMVEKFINLPYQDRKIIGINARNKMKKEFDRNIVINTYLDQIDKI